MTLNLQTIEALTTLYSSPDRYYHNMRHINRCLAEVDKLQMQLPEKDLLKAAFWFHDAIYNPYSKTNEADSATLFKNSITLMHARNIDMCVNLIKITALHTEHIDFNDSNIETQLQQYMLDIDLISLADSKYQYVNNSRNIRKEYYCYDDNDYLNGRIDFLKKMLKRPSLFYSDCYKHLEREARLNLDGELDALKFGGYDAKTFYGIIL